ncbi:MAG: acyl-CoA dehydrogenase family protein [Deltaproteobacteria bacterium]|nr:acyl-CoA dehydrogenase family protein [Deltaproteobacteria bacterium]MBW1874611.1 acyl-CoA dehydrogenase family protein [Deltaproteobacteria bacterium]MBW2214757.1 acyl-CoA dehydrogenase family protein [Deltaproteobacteria bacterium]MBW2378653.1 acyl-CoA dehydrogenase family protein [Deltaproteobacteria bacterium]MBW2551546.1 acyl-CoA dehydrogenase family protein [Deltaproteobacteria bacterium]
MANFFKDNDDLQYYFDKGIDWESLVQITEHDFADADGDGFSSTEEAVDFYRDIIEMFGQFVAEEIKPYEKEIDEKGVDLIDGEVVFPERLTQIFDKIKELDLHGLPIPRELGGMNAPMMVYFINSEIMSRADVSVMAHHGFHAGIAMAALVLSALEGSTEIDPKTGRIIETRWKKAIEEIAAGEAWGCMDITEPDAGSDMAALRTIGEQDADGNWYVTGEKIFITAGHGKYHFVIARTEDADPDDPIGGLNGLSMFLVPTYEEDAEGKRKRIVQLSRVEEKLGHHGSATCGLVFDKAPAELVGQRGDGFKYMLTLMNNARLGVGFECIGLSESAYRVASEYAAERRSMGKTIDRHEMIADYLETMKTEIQGIRAMAVTACFHEEMAQKLALAIRYGDPDEIEQQRMERLMKSHQRKARRITPLLKYFGAEKAVEHARTALQIHGGNGYMTEYLPEKLLRDALVMPIYEGTSQIQALMAMKDTLGAIIGNPQAFVRRLAQARWRSLSSRNPLERRVAQLQSLSFGAQQHLVLKTAGAKVKGLRGKPIAEWSDELTKNWDPKRDFAYAMLHAERLIQLLGETTIAELLLEQAERHPERAELLERHLERAEPKARYLHDRITTTGQRLLEKLSPEASEAARQAAE